MVRYLHISTKPLQALQDTTGTYSNGRPKGLWYAHDLVWASRMDTHRQWEPYRYDFPAPILPLYEHVFSGKALLPPQEGDTFAPAPTWTRHFVYEFPLSDAIVTRGSPSRSKVLRVTPETFDRLMETVRSKRTKWYRETATSLLTNTPLAILPHVLSNARYGDTEERTAILAHLNLTPTATARELEARAKDIVEGILSEAIPLGRELSLLEYRFWSDYMPTLQSMWGGLDIDASLFAYEPAQGFLKIVAWDVPSGVLFHPAAVLGTESPESMLRARLSWGPRETATDGFVFGLTTTGEVRSLQSPPSGGRRRKTRRRVFQNPKTLKKRIR